MPLCHEDEEDSDNDFTSNDRPAGASTNGDEPSFRRYGLAPDRVYVIPNAIVSDQFKPSDSLPTGDKGRRFFGLFVLSEVLTLSNSNYRGHLAPRIPEGDRPSRGNGATHMRAIP